MPAYLATELQVTDDEDQSVVTRQQSALRRGSLSQSLSLVTSGITRFCFPLTWSEIFQLLAGRFGKSEA